VDFSGEIAEVSGRMLDTGRSPSYFYDERSLPVSTEPDIKSTVREKYGEIAKGTSGCECGPSCCGGADTATTKKIG
jgi:hypothetical protein